MKRKRHAMGGGMPCLSQSCVTPSWVAAQSTNPGGGPPPRRYRYMLFWLTPRPRPDRLAARSVTDTPASSSAERNRKAKVSGLGGLFIAGKTYGIGRRHDTATPRRARKVRRSVQLFPHLTPIYAICARSDSASRLHYSKNPRYIAVGTIHSFRRNLTL